MKQGFILDLLLVVCFLTMTMYFVVEQGYLEKASNSSVEYSKKITGNYSVSQTPKYSRDMKLRDKLPQFQESNISLRKHRNVSKCGYNVRK